MEDNGQECLTVRWVITPKVINEKPSLKAILCTKGYQELKDFRTDSPTCAKESIRLALSTAATMKWNLESIDVKAAFLQGSKIDRTIFIKPPTEAKTNKQTKLWELQKCVYGLADAPQQFYLRLQEELKNVGMTTASLDNGIYFYHHNNDLSGILVCHVDDVLWSGTEMFEQNIIKPLGCVFTFGMVHSKAFRYLGIDLEQHDDYSISLSQTNFTNSIKKVSISGNLDKTDPVNEDICSELRTVIGQLNWLACISKPEISFEVSYLSIRVTEATIEDVTKATKIVTQIQANTPRLLFPSLDRRFLHIQVFTDGSFNSLPKSGSQGGQTVLLCDNQQNCSMLAWNSSRLKKVT